MPTRGVPIKTTERYSLLAGGSRKQPRLVTEGPAFLVSRSTFMAFMASNNSPGWYPSQKKLGSQAAKPPGRPGGAGHPGALAALLRGARGVGGAPRRGEGIGARPRRVGGGVGVSIGGVVQLLAWGALTMVLFLFLCFSSPAAESFGVWFHQGSTRVPRGSARAAGWCEH